MSSPVIESTANETTTMTSTTCTTVINTNSFASMLRRIDSYENSRTISAATRTPPSKSTNIPSGWVSVGEVIDEVSKGSVQGYKIEDELLSFQREQGELIELMNFGAHSFYRFLRLQCDLPTLVAYLRRPIAFSLWDTVFGLAHKLARAILVLFPVCGTGQWYEKTGVVFEQTNNPPAGLVPFYSKSGSSRFERAREAVRLDAHANAIPKAETLQLTLGQKFLFLLAMFVPRGNPRGFLSMLQLHSKSDTPTDHFSPHLHWFVMLLHCEHQGKMTRMSTPDWKLPQAYEKSKYPVQLLRAFEPFFDMSLLLHRQVQKEHHEEYTDSYSVDDMKTDEKKCLGPEHIMLLVAVLPLRLGESIGVHAPSDVAVLMRSGCKILCRALGHGENVFESNSSQTSSQQPWFLDFDLRNAQFLRRWIESMEELARWFSEAQWRLKIGKCNVEDLVQRMASVAPESFVSTLRDVFRYIQELDMRAVYDVFDFCDKSYFTKLEFEETSTEFLTPSFQLGCTAQTRMESHASVQALLMGKRIPDRSIQVGLEAAYKAKESIWNTFHRCCFVLEDCTALNVKESETQFHSQFVNAIKDFKLAASDDEGKPIGVPPSDKAFLSQPVCLYDFFDKTSGSYSALVYADVYKMYIFYAWQWALMYSDKTNNASPFIWTQANRVRQSFFLLSLLRYDVLKLETRKIAAGPRWDAFVPYIPQLYSCPSGTPLATSFDYLNLWIPKALGMAGCSPDPKRTALVVHISRFFYACRGKAHYDTGLEGNFCVRNALSMRASHPRSRQAIAVSAFFLGLKCPGLAHAIPLRAQVLEFFSVTTEGPGLAWTSTQEAEIAKAGSSGVLQDENVSVTRIGFYGGPEVVPGDFLLLTPTQVDKICEWFEFKDSTGVWHGVVKDKKRRSMFWAVYSHLSVILPCSKHKFSLVFGQIPESQSHTTRVSDQVQWPSASVLSVFDSQSSMIRECVQHLDFAWPALRESRTAEVLGTERPAYAAFFLTMCGLELPFYFQETDAWFENMVGTDAYYGWKRAQLAVAPVFPRLEHKPDKVLSNFPIPRSASTLHPLFESVALFNASDVKEKERSVQFITQMCSSDIKCLNSPVEKPMLYLPPAATSPVNTSTTAKRLIPPVPKPYEKRTKTNNDDPTRWS